MTVNVLALDLGTWCGYAFTCGGEIHHGTERFMQRRSWHAGRRWSDFREWLSSLISREQISVIAYEDVRRHKGTQAAHVYGGFRSMVEMVAQQHNVVLVGVGVGVIKKAWTGRGNADKAAMLAEARSRGFAPIDDNAADALAILHIATTKEIV